MSAAPRIRVAVALEAVTDEVAPRLGRAVKFALFDYRDGEIRGPTYRVRHDDPGATCGHHAELTGLLRDCQVVMAGSAGPKMTQRLQQLGIEWVTSAENAAPLTLIRKYFDGSLARTPAPACAGRTNQTS